MRTSKTISPSLFRRLPRSITPSSNGSLGRARSKRTKPLNLPSRATSPTFLQREMKSCSSTASLMLKSPTSLMPYRLPERMMWLRTSVRCNYPPPMINRNSNKPPKTLSRRFCPLRNLLTTASLQASHSPTELLMSQNQSTTINSSLKLEMSKLFTNYRFRSRRIYKTRRCSTSIEKDTSSISRRWRDTVLSIWRSSSPRRRILMMSHIQSPEASDKPWRTNWWKRAINYDTNDKLRWTTINYLR